MGKDKRRGSRDGPAFDKPFIRRWGGENGRRKGKGLKRASSRAVRRMGRDEAAGRRSRKGVYSHIRECNWRGW